MVGKLYPKNEHSVERTFRVLRGSCPLHTILGISRCRVKAR